LSKAATISKLEALLSRIRTRAAEPRSAGQPAPAPAVAAVPAPAVVAAPSPVATPATAVVAPPAAVAPAPVFVTPTTQAFVPPTSPASAPPDLSEGPAESIPPEMLEETTLPPPPLTDAPGDADFDVDVDVGTTPQPAGARAESDSRERLSAAPAAEPEAVAADAGPLPDEDEMASAPADEDQTDEAPASSRRPVAPPPEERLAELAFGTEEQQPARHTPPPKSGRLPAPPAVEFDADVTGVRDAPRLNADDDAASAQGEPSVLSPQAVRADLASGANVRVPDVIGEAQAFAPATFLALLDASLSL
jgi:hypothetical protein